MVDNWWAGGLHICICVPMRQYLLSLEPLKIMSSYSPVNEVVSTTVLNMYTYARIAVYIFMYVCMCTYMYMRIHAYIHTYLYTHMYVHK